MMQYSSLLLVGLVSLGSTVTTVTAFDNQGKSPAALPKRSFTTTNGPCTAVCKDDLFNDCDVHCFAKPTPQEVLHKHSSVTVTVAAGGVTATVACKPGVDGLGDCSALTDAPSPTSKPTLQITKVNQDLAKRSSEPVAQAAVHKHSSVSVTVAYSDMTVTLLCNADTDDFDDCRDLDPRATQKPVLGERGIVTVTNDGCTAVCWNNKPSPACDLQCDGGFAAQVALPTPKPTLKPVLQPRGLTTTRDGCTAVCWDQYPGTGCDILCHDTSVTKMPEQTSGVSSMWTTSFTSLGCTFSCQDLYPGSECGVQCPGPLPTRAFCNMIDFLIQIPLAIFLYFFSRTMMVSTGLTSFLAAPAKAALSASSIEARKELQARQAREARLARKFGVDARDDQQEAVSEAAAALSRASVVIAEAAITTTPGVVLPSAASVAMAQAASFLSSVSETSTPTTVSATLTGTAPVTLASGGTASIIFPAPTGNNSIVSPTLKSSTAWLSSLLARPTPTSPSTSVSIIITNGTDGTTSTIVFKGGASYESHGLAGLLLLIMVGVIGSVAFMI